MKNLSNIVKTNKALRAKKSIITIEDFKKYAHATLSTNEAYDHDTVDQLIESLVKEHQSDVIATMEAFESFTANIEQIEEGRREPIELTPKSFFKVFDHISVFDALYDLWLEYNTATWYSSHIGKSIDCAKRFIDQYASSVSAYHYRYKHAKLNISDAETLLKGKQFATIVKRSIEWKELKDFMATYDVDAATATEAATVIAIVKSAFVEIDKFITIVSSK